MYRRSLEVAEVGAVVHSREGRSGRVAKGDGVEGSHQPLWLYVALSRLSVVRETLKL